MNDKKNFVILLIIMVALIGGAYGVYTALSDKVERQGLVAQENFQAGSVAGTSQSGEAGSSSEQNRGDSAGAEVSQSGSGQSSGSTGQEQGAGEEATAGNGSAEGEDASQTAELAPDFTVYDAEGNAHKLSDFRGKPVIVNFWASWCGPCKSEMPDFQEVFELYGEEIHFLMVNMTDGAQETVESASAFIAESGYTFPVYYDTDMDAAYTYGVYSIPTTYFFDAEGYGVAYGSGALDREIIQTGIDMIYSK